MDKVKQGKKSRRVGKEFEKTVQKDLESKGWVVARWTKNVELDKHENIPDFEGDDKVCTFSMPVHKLIDAKPKFNPFTHSLMMNSSGFPDFICFFHDLKSKFLYGNIACSIPEISGFGSLIIGVECKTNGRLDKIEKEKIKWLLDNHIFSKILLAKKDKKGGIEYSEIKPIPEGKILPRHKTN